MIDARDVLVSYPPAIAMARWQPLASAGGFSGASVWHGLAADGREFALKMHAPAADAERLRNVLHPAMIAGRVAGLDFVPQVERTRVGSTVVEHGGRIFDVCEWMTGQADYHANPTDARLVIAVTAIARLHEVWSRFSSHQWKPCPAIARRWRAIQEWEKLVASGWRPIWTPADPVRPHAEAAWSRLPPLLPRVREALTPCLTLPIPVQMCLCDVWHDHVLYIGERVTGLIDFGAAKEDHVAVDLARLLGSLVPDDPNRYHVALQAYATIRPLPQPELVAVLDWTGTIVGIMNWLRWLYYESRECADRHAVARRLEALVQRLERGE